MTPWLMARGVVVVSMVAVMSSCGGGAQPEVDAGGAVDSGATGDAGAMTSMDAGLDAGTDAGVVVMTECELALRAPSEATTTYYVAIEEPGASNTACDGLAPTAESATHCPYKDFTVTKTTHLLDQVKSTRVVVRRGTYAVHGWEGLKITGLGASERERVELTSYPGETVILDTDDPNGAVCFALTDPMQDDRCVREALRVSGNYTLVQGLTVRNALAYQVEFTGGAHHVARCNRFDVTGVGHARSDMMKMDAKADDVLVRKNEFTHWNSQAIDITGVSNIVVEANDFHDPLDADGNAIGMKYGTRNVTIRDNDIHDLGSDASRGKGIAAGGNGTPHPDDAEAYGLHIENNRFRKIAGAATVFNSCRGCSFTGNQVNEVGAGVWANTQSTGGADCSTATAGCLPTNDLVVRDNRFKNLVAPTANQSNTFVFIEEGEHAGFAASGNVYCSTADVSLARFFWRSGSTPLSFTDWKTQSGTDADSVVLAATDARCLAP